MSPHDSGLLALLAFALLLACLGYCSWEAHHRGLTLREWWARLR